MMQHISEFYFYLRLNNKYTIVCVPHSVYPFICWQILGWSPLGLLWIMLLWTLVCNYLIPYFHFFCVYTQEENWWNICWFFLCLTFWGIELFHSGYAILHSHQQCTTVSALYTFSSTLVVFRGFFPPIIAILMAIKTSF